MSINLSGIGGSLPAGYDVDGTPVDLVPETPRPVGAAGDAALEEVAAAAQVQGGGPAGSVAPAVPLGEDLVALPRSDEPLAADAPAAVDVPLEPDKRNTTLAIHSKPAAASSKYGYRYVYSYRYSAAAGRMIRTLRPVMRPRLAGSMPSAKPARSSKTSVRGARHQVAPEVRQANIDRITAWRDGMQQLHSPSISNYERQVDARVADDAIEESLEGDGALALGD